MKISKDNAEYGQGMKSAHCAICRHFETPDRCERVIGKISPRGWCRLYVKQQEEKAA